MPISIILPTYNDSHFISKALQSCFNQNVEKEIIVIDDGSSNPIDPAAQELMKNPLVRFIKHETNKGLAAARNTAISAAKYDLIIPIDSDDWFFDNVLEKLEAEMTDDADVVYGNVFDNYLHYPVKEPFTKEHFIRDNPLFCSSLFRKSIWKKAGGYMERKGPHYEDWNFWARCFKNGAKFKYIDLTVYNHTSREDGMLRILHPNRDFYRKLATEGIFND
jgi:glycosyltransferase involved in cell wall biosynthesis